MIKNLIFKRLMPLIAALTLGIVAANAQDAQIIEVNVTEPGSLGDLVLSQVENFTDVVSLKISGKLNDDDIVNIQRRMTELRHLDMAAVDMTAVPAKFLQGRKLIETFMLPGNAETIGDYAFSECTALTAIDFPASLRSIGSYAFNKCNKIKHIKLPPTLTTLSNYAFAYCSALADVEFSECLTTIGDGCFREDSLVSIDLPASLREIKSSAFASCKQLTEVKLKEGLYSIGNSAFSRCSALTEITLPSSLVFANNNAFEYCTSLVKVTCLALQPPYLENQLIYGEKMDGRELYVSQLAINHYKQTAGWDLFPTILPIDQLPESITIFKEFKISLPDNLPIDYKPNLKLLKERENSSSLYKYSHLDVCGNATLSLAEFSTLWEITAAYFSENSVPNTHCSLITDSRMRADNITVDVYVRGGYWTFFSLPFDVKMSDIETPGYDGFIYIIRGYDGKRRAEGKTSETWVKMTADSTLHAGRGYIIHRPKKYHDQTVETLAFRFKSMNNTKKNNFFISDDATVTLERNDGEGVFAHNRGWNLIGNPYPSYYDTRFCNFNAPITVYDPINYIYRAYSPLDDSYILMPGQSFFIQAPIDNNVITFDKEGRQHNNTVRTLETQRRAPAADMHRTVLNISLTGNELTDMTRVVINPDALDTYECDKDASKFKGFDATVSQIYTNSDGIDYAINERPLGEGKVALNTYIGSTGIYTIALNSAATGYKVLLEDLKNGNLTDLTDGNEYTFSAEPQDDAARFMLHIQLDTTSILDVDAAADTDGAIYTIEGIRIDCPTRPGIYVQKNKKILVK